MSRIDKKLAEQDYVIRHMELADWHNVKKKPVIYIEYVKDLRIKVSSDDVSFEPYEVRYVQIFVSGIKKYEYAIRVMYEGDQIGASSGGDREYGSVIRAIPVEELKLFVKKAEELQRQLRKRSRLRKIFRKN